MKKRPNATTPITYNKMLNFFGKKKDGRELSNFYEGIVVLDGDRVYKSGESAFHGSKYLKAAESCADANRRLELIDYAKRFEVGGEYGDLNGNEIKKRGGKGKNGKKLNPAEISVWSRLGTDVQRDICKYKFENDEIVKSALLATTGKVLIHPAMRCSKEKVKDRLWEGRGEIVDGKVVVWGGNMLGNIWMDLRDGR